MTKQTEKIKTLTIAAMLCAIGIMIPMVAPKIIIPPASFTLGSHVAVFIAMFISPPVAVAVAGISAIGFFIAGFPTIIVLRALTHLIFATLGAYILKKNNNILLSMKSTALFAFGISVVHAIAEVIVVSLFFFGGEVTSSKGYLFTVVVMVGVGTVIHSIIDFSIATFIWKPLQYIITIPANAKIRVK